MGDLGRAFYRGDVQWTVQDNEVAAAHQHGEVRAALDKVIADCEMKPPDDEAMIVLFLAKPTRAAEQPVLVHVVYLPGRQNRVQEAGALPGVTKLTFVYITDNERDVVVSQLSVSRVDNPAVAQLGQLAAALAPGLGTLAAPPTVAPGLATVPPTILYVLVARHVDIRFKRSSVVENDFVGTPLPHLTAPYLCYGTTPDKATCQQITGSLNLTNTPLTWWTVNAGVGFRISPVHGAQRMKVDTGVYASDPIPVGMTMAGVTFHGRYDASSPNVTWRERVGVFAGGVITPNGGIAVGMSIGVARNLAVVGGYTGQLVPTALSDKKPGDGAGNVDPQTRTGVSRAWFAGLIYAFK
jgi:hypothetical protein